jgi:tetratricopeptide (TPR) repeat protein
MKLPLTNPLKPFIIPSIMANPKKPKRYGIDWDRCEKFGYTKRDYDIILYETTKIIEDKNFSDEYERAVAYYDRGIVHSDRNEDQMAIDDYTSAIKISGQPEAYYNRGGVYLYLRQYFMALKDFLKVKEIDPDDTEIDKDIDELRKKLII